MHRRFSLTQGLILAAILAAVTLGVIERRGRALDAASLQDFQRDNLSWHTTQLQVETMRFTVSAARFGLPDGPSAAAVAERFDLLWSRHAQFGARALSTRLAALDEAGVVRALGALLLRHEAAAMALDAADVAARAAMVNDFAALAPALQEYNARAEGVEDERLSQLYTEVLRSNAVGRGIGYGALAVAALLLAAGYLQARVDRSRLADQQRLTGEARVAAEAKSRFLTMMSHELRTPMNGVLGILSVLASTRIDERQTKLLQVARRSAGEMLGLVEDILDLSDIQAGRREAEIEAISLDMLAMEIAEAIALRLDPPDPELSASAFGAAETVVTLDRRAVVKAVRQITLFLHERLRIRGNRIGLSLKGRRLLISIFAPDAAHAKWEPDALLGPLTAKGAAIQTEAIGPALARALIADAGGEASLRKLPDGALELIVSIPVSVAAGQGAAAHEPPSAPARRRA